MTSASRTFKSDPRGSILLLEKEYMLRSAFALNAKETGLADVYQANSLLAASEQCKKSSFDGVVLGCSPGLEELALLNQIREGATACKSTVPIVVMLEACAPDLLLKLKQLAVKQILLRPLRIRSIQEAVVNILAA